jgi:hypothetical protein
MAEVVNLNRFRKERRRQEAARIAEENRARFGRPKSERNKTEGEQAKADKDLDGKRLD